MRTIEISRDSARLDRELIHDYLCNQSYWATGRSREIMDRAIDGSLCFGAYDEDGQVGFARVVTDRATFGYLADVFVVPAAQGQGVGKALVRAVLSTPELQDLTRFVLATQDAHSLYARFGFQPLGNVSRWMELRPDASDDSPRGSA